MPASPRGYVIGLGANLGDREGALRSAITGLSQLGSVRAVSAVYESAAVGPPQPDYLNAAVLLESSLEPRELLAGLLALERAHGRERLERWGPRTLDLDLLCAGDLVLEEPGLSLPHPELPGRAFALLPLLDVAPDARDARSGALYRELAERVDASEVRRLRTVLTPAEPEGPTSLQGERNGDAI